MEPIKINVNVEVGLKQETLEALKGLFGPQIIPSSTKIEGPEPQQAPKPEPQQAPEPKTPAKPAPAPAPAPVEDDDDLPPNDAPDPAPKKVPTEAEMRAEIQKTRKRGVPTKTIRDYIKDTFGVEASVDCPPEKRQALIDGLANLAA